MQLSSRILTALAVLILAVAVVAVRGGGGVETVEAATGTIDVLNVGTCYATDTDVFDVGDCDDGDGDYDVAGRDSITETGTVYSTYAHDPKTAAESPRAVLLNSNLIKISIEDTGRDKRTKVLYQAGSIVQTDTDEGDYPFIDDVDTTNHDEGIAKRTIIEDHPGIALEPEYRWNDKNSDPSNTPFTIGDADPKVINGITLYEESSVCSATDPCDYKPMFADGDDTPISIYGLYDANNDGNYEDEGEGFMNLTKSKYLSIDEDVGSGRTTNAGGIDQDGDPTEKVSPWFSVQVNLKAGAELTVLYVVYETSEREVLEGNKSAKQIDDVKEDEDVDADEDIKLGPKPGKSEDADTPLIVSARSDGVERSRNLFLKETSRFSGRYEGYLRLTDAGGDNGDGAPNNWGRGVVHGSSHIPDGAAVLGVESGPVIIEYRDTDGATKSATISIDTSPPEIQIDTPANKSQGQDTSPEFSGAFTDDASGLRKDSFNLYVDDTNDSAENGESGTNLALDLRVDGQGGEHVSGHVTSEKVVSGQQDYTGWTDAIPEFGVVDPSLYTEQADDDSGVLIVEGDNHDDGALSGTFGDSVRIGFTPEGEDGNFNNTIDYQALVMDVAGNIGFSDSDPEGPEYINNLGVESDDRNVGKYNVLGWYSRHIFFLDETDPKLEPDQTVTGFFGEDDDKPQANRSGILVSFDAAVDPDTIDLDTFNVTLDPVGDSSTGAGASIVDVQVSGKRVYLLLAEELASDATPAIDIPPGQWVSDPAGNRLSGGRDPAFKANDGIAPVLTVTLSGGSGTGEGNEGPSKLTKDTITVTIGADEEIQGTPSLVVVCSDINWGDNDQHELSYLVSERSGSLPAPNTAGFTDPMHYDCGDSRQEQEGMVQLQQAQSYSRPGLEWEYEWVDFSGDKRLPDGKLTVVAYARDRSPYDAKAVDDGATGMRYDWGAATAEFRYDTEFDDEDPNVKPAEGATVTDSRPFVLLTYAASEPTVTIEEFKIDGTVQEVQTLGDNRFLYWPESLSIGDHTVNVTAVNAAGVKLPTEYSFTRSERKAFNVKLIAGWNAVSFPANPEDPMIENVFTEGVVDMIASWDNSEPTKPWSIATRMEGEWSTHSDFATLTKVSAKFGYWVHAQGFTTQRVQLVGNISRVEPGVVPPDLLAIPTIPGWNFVGVIDQDGDQTEDSFGDDLMSKDDPVNAETYLGSAAVKAYTWDAVRSEFKVLEPEDPVEIGDGIWVYFGEGIAP